MSTIPKSGTEERRGLMQPVECREDGGTATLRGVAAVYHEETIIMGLWREQIAPGAFASALNGTDDVRALFNHDPNFLLGRTKSGTLQLEDSPKGLRYTVTLPETQAAQDVRTLIKRGDVSGSSFGFIVEEDEWDETPTKRGLLPIRTIQQVELFDVSPVTYPAYPSTSVTARAKAEAVTEAMRRGVDCAVRDRQRMRIVLERARMWLR